VKTVAALSLASGIGCCSLAFADGALDATFGVDGVARAGIPDGDGAPSGCRPIVLADGRILICGTRLSNGVSGADFMVARFNVDGSLDPTFGDNGLTTIDFDQGTGGDHAEGIALQADGHIIVGGTTHGAGLQSDDFAVARLTADGVLDQSFATAGKATIAFDLANGVGNDDMSALTVESDGAIVLAGSAETMTGSVVAVARLLGDGSRDANFNATGKVTFGFALAGSEADHANAAAVDGQGRIVVAATATTNEQMETNEFAVARLLANGTLDTDFAGVGYVAIPFDPGTGISDARALGLALLGNGEIAISGYSNSSPWATPNMDMAAARLRSDGSLDATFGNGGTLTIPFDIEQNGMDAAVDVLEQSDGRLLLVGTALGGGQQYGVAARLLGDGTFDSSFGTAGKATYNLGLTAPGTQAFTGVTMQGSRILVGGVAFIAPLGTPQPLDCVLVRLSNDVGDAIFAAAFD